MSENPNGVAQLAEEFEDCRRILLALGDENRQHLILEMMRMDQCGGVRVGAITERSHLSRPAVSHHVRILKDAGLLNVRREGTKNYYYFDANTQAMDRLIRMLLHAKAIMEQLPDRSGDQYWRPILRRKKSYESDGCHAGPPQCAPISKQTPGGGGNLRHAGRDCGV